MDTLVVITGLLGPLHVENLIALYKYTPNKLVSTWNDQPPELIKKLVENGFYVLGNKYPELRTSANLQIVCAHNGIAWAINKGFKYVCRMRTDVFPLNFELFLEKTEAIYTEDLMVICGKETSFVYFLDIIVAGPVDKMLKFFGTLQPTGDTRIPEKFLLETYAGPGRPIVTREDVKSVFKTCLDVCKRESIEFLWVRLPGWYVGKRSNPFMRVISEYCAEDTIF